MFNGKHIDGATAVSGALVFVALTSAREHNEPAYRIIKEDGKFQVREYEPYILAQVDAGPDFNGALYAGFMKLFNYISGKNTGRSKIRMTVPVPEEQIPVPEKIPMTAPVTSERSGGSHIISFIMPDTYTLETLPVPDDKRVKFRAMPAHRAAVVRFSGRASEELADKKARELEGWMVRNGLTAASDYVMAQYNPPWIPGFIRRNEIMIRVTDVPGNTGD